MHTNKNHTISFNNKPSVTSTQIANSFNKQFTNTVPHTSNKTNRKIDKQVHKLPKTTFILTTSEISAAIRNSKNNNSTGPDGISIRHLKHIGPLGLTYLTNTFNLALNTNTIPHMWKLANIIPILKPDKDHNTGTSFRPISLLSVISKTLEKALLPYITNNIPQHHTQHGFKAKHSTTTALHNINNTIASGFNQRIPPARTIAVALDMSKAFDTVNIHTLTKKLLDTQIPPILIKFIANYIKGRKAFTTYNNKTDHPERRMQPARGRFARFDLDRQIASTFPAHWKVGPAPVFWASQPLEPAEWLALLILKAGDVESNPGPQNRKLPPSALTTQTTTLNSTTHSHATTSHPNQKLLTLLQLNINSITNKHEELKLLVTELQPDIITIQETKLKKHNKTPQIPTYSAIRTDRANGKGGGLLTYIKHNITFSDTKIHNFINPINTELQIIQLHITNNKIYTIANIYTPPRNTTSPDHATCDADITSCIQYITNLPNSIISGDINAHSPIWHSHTTDHRGDLIADLLGNSDHITLNTNTHTRLPFAANQRPTSPDITSITTNLYNRTHWETLNALNSDHLPILTTINTRTNFRLQQNRQTYTNYNKANWQNFTTETESSFRNINPPSVTHTANKILTNIILNADKHNIPKGKIQHNCKLLPEDIRTKINTRNNIRKHNPLDPNLAQLNNKITSDIQHHKTALWKSHLDGNWDHRENTHTLWKTLKNLSNKKMHTNKNHTISFNNKPSVTSTQIANSFNKQFTNTVPHTSNKTNRKIDKQVHKLPKTTFILTTSEISAAIRNSKNNNSTGPDGISIRHLKHIGPLGLTYLTNTFILALNTNTTPHMWKLANIIPILKPDKDHNTGTSFRPISLLSVISKTLEKALLPCITNNIPQHHTQHGFKAKHSTTTALHNINNTIASGFNQRIPPARTIAVALDMSKAFDTVNIHKEIIHTQKLSQRNF